MKKIFAIAIAAVMMLVLCVSVSYLVYGIDKVFQTCFRRKIDENKNHNMS